jgi:hypothetical protein
MDRLNLRSMAPVLDPTTLTPLVPYHRVCTRGRHGWCDFACATRLFQGTSKCLLVRPEKEVIGRVALELSLTHRASGSGGRSAFGV